MFIEREIGHQALQPPVFVLELPEPPELAHAQVRVLLLPGIDRRFTDAELPADIADPRAGLDLAEG